MSGDSVDIKGQIMNMTMLIMNMLTMSTTWPWKHKEIRLTPLHVPLSTLTSWANNVKQYYNMYLNLPQLVSSLDGNKIKSKLKRKLFAECGVGVVW